MSAIRSVLIVGGGTAGWLAACHLAKKLLAAAPDGVQVTLLESADIPTIGVGEGTVPAMRQSLQYLGISETEFIQRCDVTFKQSIKFVDWVHGPASAQPDYYHHIFDYPELNRLDLTPYWLQGVLGEQSYADAVSIQSRLADAGFSPKTMLHGEFQGLTSYAYHLDAAKFAALLTEHATQKLGVKHLLGTVSQVQVGSDGNIAAVHTREQGCLTADLYIDCTGFRSLLLGEALQVPFIRKNDVLFCDRALAVQVPYEDPQQPIPCFTISTAQGAGWIWDIGLTERRGTGYVFSSAFTSPEQAHDDLLAYLPASAKNLTPRLIEMNIGYRERFWQGNCVALGLSQGFVEPLEATGLLVYDATARMLAESFPHSVEAMPLLAQRFNQRVRHTWDRVIDFIKLHYFLSKRDDTEFWRANRQISTCPTSLLDNLALWQHQVPTAYDFHSKLEIFNLENYLYVLYGMQFPTKAPMASRAPLAEQAQQLSRFYAQKAQQLQRELVPHRQLLERIRRYGLQAV